MPVESSFAAGIYKLRYNKMTIRMYSFFLLMIFLTCNQVVTADDDFDFQKKTDTARAKTIQHALNNSARLFYKSTNQPPHQFLDFMCYKKDIDAPDCTYELKQYQQYFTNILTNKDFLSRVFKLQFKDGTVACYKLTRRKVFVSFPE